MSSLRRLNMKRDFFEEIVTGRHIASDRGFEVNTAGIELLQSGAKHFEQICAQLAEIVAPIAADIANPSALVRRFPGIDYLLQYFLQEGLLIQPAHVVGIIETFPPTLKAETLNVALRMRGSVRGKEIVGGCAEFLTFAFENLESKYSDVSNAADRLICAIQREKSTGE